MDGECLRIHTFILCRGQIGKCIKIGHLQKGVLQMMLND